MKKLLQALTLLFIMPFGAADFESNIAAECGDSEPVISISDPETEQSKPAEPYYYEDQLCVSGISETKIQKEACGLNTGFYLSGIEDDSRFSIYEDYEYNVCTGKMETRLTDIGGSCNENETALISVSAADDADVAAPGVFDQQICGSYDSLDSVTVSMKFNLSSSDTVRFSDQIFEGERSFSSSEYPYMASSGEDMIAGIVTPDFKSESRDINGENVLSMRKSTGSYSFFLPFTTGNIGDIERREELVTENRLLQQISPSFGFDIPGESPVRVLYRPEVDLKSDKRYGLGENSLEIVKTGEEEVKLK